MYVWGAINFLMYMGGWHGHQWIKEKKKLAKITMAKGMENLMKRLLVDEAQFSTVNHFG